MPNEEFLKRNPDYIDILQDLVEYEEDNKDPEHTFIEDQEYDCCWENGEVSHHPSKLYQLEVNGFLDRVFDSNSTTAYSLIDRDGIKDIIDGGDSFEEDPDTEKVMHSFPSEDELPGDLFGDVVGYDDVKWLLKRGLTTDDITNFLLIGEPGSAKTVFLLCIQELEGAEFIPATDLTSSGFLEVMFDKTPKYMLLDEMDDMKKKHQQTLSSYTETGILKETKYKKTRQMKTNTKTFATANNTSDILPHIEDRFIDLHFSPYTENEYVEVCTHLLPRRQGVTQGEAKEIAELLWDRHNSGDVRKAIAVARLSRGDPRKVVGVLDDYSRDNLESLLG